VIQAIKLDGLKISEASVLLGISRDTIRLWLKRERETRDFQALPNKPPGNGHKITDWEKFTNFVEVKVDKTQVEMAQLWPEEISDRTISRALNPHSAPSTGTHTVEVLMRVDGRLELSRNTQKTV
jgi:Transposase.